MAGKYIHRVCVTDDFCKGCAICTTVCPEELLEIDNHHLNSQGYNPVCVDLSRECVGCGNCVLMCPDNAILIEKSAR